MPPPSSKGTHMEKKSVIALLLGVAAGLSLNSHAQLLNDGGFFKHQSSNLCLEPLSNPFDPNAKTLLVFAECRGDLGQRFRWLNNGSIQHVASGRCAKPEGPLSDVTPLDRLRLEPVCGKKKQAFEHRNNGAISHTASALCIHPEVGGLTPEIGSRTLLKGGCGNQKTFF